MRKRREYRHFTSETRARGNVVTGYAAVFDSEIELFSGLREVIRQGAFTKTIKDKQKSGNADIKILWNHNPSEPLGRTKNGSLELSEDDHGLRFNWTPGATQREQQAVADIRNGLVDQMSFGFRVVKEIFTEVKKDLILREINEVELFEISPVTFPAYEDTIAMAEEVSKNILSEARKNNLIMAQQTTIEPLYGDTHSEPSRDQHSIAEAIAKREAWLERESALHAMETDYNGYKAKKDCGYPAGVAGS